MSDWLSGLPDSQVPMPTPNAAPKTVSKKTPEKKGVELGQTLAKKRSQDFKSKVADWDGAGAGVGQAQDEVIVVVDDNDDSSEEPAIEAKDFAKEGGGVDNKSKQKTPKTPISASKPTTTETTPRKTSRDVDAGRKAWVKRKGKPQEVSPDLKEATAPKKRVVSDGHWRRDRAKKEAETPEKPKEKEKEKDTTPKPITVRRSVVSVGLKVPPSTFEFKEDPQPVRRRQLPRRSRSRSESRDRVCEREATPDYESGGTKVYVKRRRRLRTLEPDANARKAFSTSESSLTVDSSITKPSTGTDVTSPDPLPAKVLPVRPRTAPRERSAFLPPKETTARKISAGRSFEAEDVPRRNSRRLSKTPDHNDNLRKTWRPASAKDNTQQTSRIPSSKPPDPAPKIFGNRIQGWLANMPDDPFTAPSEPSLAPEPLDVPRRRLNRGEESDAVEDSDMRRSSGHRRRSRPSLEPVRRSGDEWSDGSPAPTPTLQRSGARRSTYSPVKERSARVASLGVDDNMDRPNLLRSNSRRHTPKERTRPRIPSTENRLSTIVSVESFQAPPRRPRAPSAGSDHPTVMEGSVLSRASDGDEPVRGGTGLKRRLTKHSDLMSVLSDDRPGVPHRSIRRPKHDVTTMEHLMNDVTTDELKYQRELRTLVDGVIPVLLQYVISKNGSSNKLTHRKSSMPGDPALTQPIVDMGVALERLRTSHKRIPMHNPNELLLWAQSTASIYADYLKAWRLGFQDVVVNLAPAEETKRDGSPHWDEGLHRDERGDLLDGDGERVDVAHLLKRPLVRLKTLGKTFKGINLAKPSALAEDVETHYQDMVARARQRNNEERARLEDEAAAAIDPNRARDPRSLAPLSGVNIDPTRCVRARDYFDLEMVHSSGQQLDCKVELIVRDDAPERGPTGDILFCEISTTGRWLLFPPVLASNVSARKGGKDDDLVVMVRGMLASGNEWREVMSLQSSQDQVVEWLQMLQSDPVPPRLSKQSSFNALRGAAARQDGTASPTESEIPIGERAHANARRWDGSDVNSISNGRTTWEAQKPTPKRYRGATASPQARAELSEPEDAYHTRQQYQRGEAGYTSSLEHGQRPVANHARSKSEWTTGRGPLTANNGYDTRPRSTIYSADEHNAAERHQHKAARPAMHRRTSSVPSLDLPTIPKLRKTTEPITPAKSESCGISHQSKAGFTNDPSSAPAKLQKRQQSVPKDEAKDFSSRAPPSSIQAKPTSVGLRSGALPSFTPAFLKKHRRSSSPLKHEYEPSTASDSSSESDLSDVDDVQSITSYSTIDEAISTIGDLQNFGKLGEPRARVHPTRQKSGAPVDVDSLRPSDSPSQAPYRKVPPSTTGSAKSVACIFSWAENGSWNSLHPQECEIVVTPGLIEAFDLAQANAVASRDSNKAQSSPSAKGVKPLVALEMTPLVPLRRGTALDISIRSPPTSNSVLRNGNNFMLRSRSPEDCEKLYNLINRARIDNPTWIALQNARGPVQTSNWGEMMDRRNAARSSTGVTWMKSLSRRASTYRSKGPRSASVAGSQSSVGTMNSAMSALRRFSTGSKIFNVAKSTIMSKEGTRSTDSSFLSSGRATPVPFDTKMGTPVGVTEAKVRLYLRESATKWRDMGAARLTVMLPPRSDSAVPVDPRTTGLEKRILISGKSKGETLLDVTLGESCFERIARTGIAISVWQEGLGPNGEIGHAAATGGVVSSRSTVYMVQMKSDAVAAYTFSMVGRLRY